MRRAVTFIATVAFAVVAVSQAATADPKSEPLFLDCEGVPSGVITTTPGNGAWPPGFDSSSRAVYIPYAFVFDFYFTPDGGQEQFVDTESISKKAPRNTRAHPHGFCTFELTFPVDDPELGTGLGRVEGSVRVFYTG